MCFLGGAGGGEINWAGAPREFMKNSFRLRFLRIFFFFFGGSNKSSKRLRDGVGTKVEFKNREPGCRVFLVDLVCFPLDVCSTGVFPLLTQNEGQEGL